MAVVHVRVAAGRRFDAPVPIAVAVGKRMGGIQVDPVHSAWDVASDAVSVGQGVGGIAVLEGVRVAFVLPSRLVLVVAVP